MIPSKVFAQYPLHFAVWNNDNKLLQKLLKNQCNIDLSNQFGQTPLELAVLLNRYDSVKILLEYGASVVDTLSKDGWSIIHEAISIGDPKLLQLLMQYRYYQRYVKEMETIPRILKAINDAPDFYFEMKWEFSSLIPFVSRFCPSDTCKIWKSGPHVRIDSTLLDFHDQGFSRGNKSYIFHGSGAGTKFLELNHDDKTFKTEIYERGLPLETIELELMKPHPSYIKQRLKNPLVTAYLDVDNIEFVRNKSGLIWKDDRTECINGYKCKVYDVLNAELITKTRCEHLDESARQRLRQNTGFIYDMGILNTLFGFKTVLDTTTTVCATHEENHINSASSHKDECENNINPKSSIDSFLSLSVDSTTNDSIENGHLIKNALDVKNSNDSIKRSFQQNKNENYVQTLPFNHSEENNDDDGEVFEDTCDTFPCVNLENSTKNYDFKAVNLTNNFPNDNSTTALNCDDSVNNKCHIDCDEYVVDTHHTITKTNETAVKNEIDPIYNPYNLTFEQYIANYEMVSSFNTNSCPRGHNQNFINSNSNYHPSNEVKSTDYKTKLKSMFNANNPPQTFMVNDNGQHGVKSDKIRHTKRHIGRLKKEIVNKSRKFRATIWLSEECPLSLQDQIIPIIDLMPKSNPHIIKLKEFITLQLPPGFPVKIEIPLFHVLNARITFGNICAKDTSVYGVYHIQSDAAHTSQNSSSCIIDSSVFNIPPGYTDISNDSTSIQQGFPYHLSNFSASTTNIGSMQSSNNFDDDKQGINENEKVTVWEALGTKTSKDSQKENCDLQKTKSLPTEEDEELERVLQLSRLEYEMNIQNLALNDDFNKALQLSLVDK